MKAILLKSMIGIILFSIITGCSNQKAEKKSNSQKDISTSLDLKEGTYEYVILDDSLKENLIKKGAKIAKLTASSLQKALKNAIKEDGLEYAIEICNIDALNITDSISESESVKIKRLAKKYRNTVNETDSTESELFKSYILEWLGGRQLNPKIIPNDNGHPVYYNPIYVGKLCLNCHGETGKNIDSNLAKFINELYPDDKATNFKQGQLRGMWSITFTEYKVK